MKKDLRIFSIVILVLGFVVAPTLAEETTVPTEVERVKDFYYFKIHGGPWTPPAPPDYGIAEFIYKNLSTESQSINVIIESTWAGRHEFWQFPYVLAPGQEFSSGAPEDFGVIAGFELYIGGSLEFSGAIWVPPPP